MNYQMRKVSAYHRLAKLAEAAELIQNSDMMEKQALPWGAIAKGGLQLARRAAPRLLQGIGRTLRPVVPKPLFGAATRLANRHPYATAATTAGAMGTMGALRHFGRRDEPSLFNNADPRQTRQDIRRGAKRLYYSIPGVRMPGNNPTWDAERGL